MNIFSSSGSMGKEGMLNLRGYGLTKKIEAAGAEINNDMLIRRDQKISDSDRTDLSLYSTKRGLSSSTTSVFTEDASSSSPTSSTSSSSSIDDNNGPLYELSELMAKLPLKRGLSKFYDGKSQSFFTSLAEEVNSVEDLVKKENPYNKRIKLCTISYDWTALAEDR